MSLKRLTLTEGGDFIEEVAKNSTSGKINKIK
jgi:hypothetical protein